ncbi:MAG TPA: hypothetical protein VF318_02820 [Dehalococcoidales bacterium]
MWRKSTLVIIAAIFLGTSGVLYLIEYLIFKDIHFLTITLVASLAYLPLEVFLVVVLIERLLTRREKLVLIQKLNMVVGGFFSEVGNDLIRNLHDYFVKDESSHRRLAVDSHWNHADFSNAMVFAHGLKLESIPTNTDLEALREFLKSKRPFLLSLLQNPNLLEHDQFTDLLWATTHVAEELEIRTSMANLPENDLKHVSVDIERMFGHLMAQWLAYAEHLKSNYPYLFSLVSRTHPFRQKSSPTAV